MKLVSFEKDGQLLGGILDDGVVWDTSTEQPIAPVEELRLLSPTPRPGKIVCVGLNYRDHAEETGQPIPASPILFAKFVNTIAANGDDIVIPPITTMVDYEAELGVVIGRRAHRVPVEEALQYVLGYTCVNDVSARDLQLGDGQWVRGKSLDTFCPVGPWIVTTDEIADPQALGIRCVLNGRTVQDSNTSQMVFGVAELISFISQAITLEPGDLIATGTPPGVGMARTPPLYMQDGDVVRVEIDGVGVLENRVRASS